ncbi:MAG: hypothetical protein KTR31_09365 [Myxococcales bacterium]|nr:hypothetical protein [Myxococcales bacterium]
MTDGSAELALFAAVAFLGGLVLETRVLLRWRTDLYFLMSLPLGQQLVPVPRAPTGKGRTPSVRWEVSRPGLVRYWADPGERKAPSGLHGVVWLVPVGDRVALDVRWAPPLAPMGAALWLALLGMARGEAQLTVPIALMIAAAISLVYWDRSRRIAQELRFSFVGGHGEDPKS